MRHAHFVGCITVSIREFKEARVIAEAIVQNAIHPLCLFLEDLSEIVEERLEPLCCCSLSVKLVNAVGSRICLVPKVKDYLRHGPHCANRQTAAVAKNVDDQPDIKDIWYKRRWTLKRG